MNTTTLSKEDQIRKEVISVARSLFIKYGLNKTTMEDIAKAMGRGKSTLYYYYKNKEDIFDAVVTNEIEEVFNKVRNIVDQYNTGEEKALAYIHTTFSEVKKKLLLYNVVKADISEIPSIINSLKSKWDITEIQIIKDILNFGIKNKEFSNKIEKDIDLLSYALVCAQRGMIVDLTIGGKFPDWEDRMGVIGEILVRGLKL
jgi:AcrR family transcriptional regulator